MKPTRRQVLQTTAAAGTLASLVGCEKVISTVTARLGESVPHSVSIPSGATIDPAYHLLNRAAYGPWPGEADRVDRIGAETWIEEQLDFSSIDDSACDLRARRFESIHQQPGTCFEYDKRVLREEISRHTLLRAVYSKRQLYEVMVGFWSDHLNINLEKGDCIYLKPTDDREVIRKHALGRFHDMIRASGTSPAMLVYLDGNQNRKSSPKEVPNENYARELMELHTLGVHGGYAQKDVAEAARALTGWHVRERFRRGTVFFDPAHHDDGEKHVLGQVIPAGGGEKDVDRLIDICCDHPSTASHIATKLVRRFVADDPPAVLVRRVARVFTQSKGDIQSVVRAVLLSDEFKASAGQKFKPPFRYVVSCLRATGADTHAHTPLIEHLNKMGEGVFQHPTPDGYPDKADAWMGNLLWRWNFAYGLSSGTAPSVSVPMEQLLNAIGGREPQALFRYFAGREPTRAETQAFALMPNDAAGIVGTILSAPAFQRY